MIPAMLIRWVVMENPLLFLDQRSENRKNVIMHLEFVMELLLDA